MTSQRWLSGWKGALHGIDGELLKIVQSQAEGFGSCFELAAHAGIAHQAIVGVQSDSELFLIENLERVLGQAWGSASMHIADQADLNRNPLIENILREIAELHDFSFRHGNIIDQPCSVANAVRSAVLDSLPDRFLPIALPGVNRDVEILALNVVERVHVLLRRKSPFLA